MTVESLLTALIVGLLFCVALPAVLFMSTRGLPPKRRMIMRGLGLLVLSLGLLAYLWISSTILDTVDDMIGAAF